MERTVHLEFKGRGYSLSIPTNRELLSIEALKSTLSNGQYGRLVQVNTVSSIVALDRIDMISYLTVLCPDLTADLKVGSILDLDVLDSKDLVDSFTRTVAPWILEWQRALSIIPTVESVEKEINE